MKKYSEHYGTIIFFVSLNKHCRQVTGDNQCRHGCQDDILHQENILHQEKSLDWSMVSGVAFLCKWKSGDANKLSKKNYILFMRYVKKILQKKKYNAL